MGSNVRMCAVRMPVNVSDVNWFAGRVMISLVRWRSNQRDFDISGVTDVDDCEVADQQR